MMWIYFVSFKVLLECNFYFFLCVEFLMFFILKSKSSIDSLDIYVCVVLMLWKLCFWLCRVFFGYLDYNLVLWMENV